MCWGAGILLSSGIVRAVASIPGDMAWRLPFALQWMWPVPLFIAAYFAPESPWNAVRREKYDVAKQSLMRLRQDTPDKERDVDAALAYITYTTKLEKSETESASFLECFQGANLRRTEIVSLISLTSVSVHRADLDLELCRLGRPDPLWQCHPWLLSCLPRGRRLL